MQILLDVKNIEENLEKLVGVIRSFKDDNYMFDLAVPDLAVGKNYYEYLELIVSISVGKLTSVKMPFNIMRGTEVWYSYEPYEKNTELDDALLRLGSYICKNA